MRNYNKAAIESGEFSSSFSFTRRNIEYESPTWTSKKSISFGYTFTNHQLRLIYQTGHVGSRLTGTSVSIDDVGSSFTFDLRNTKNITHYKSYGLRYGYKLPIDSDYFLFELGVSRQNNSFEDTLIPVFGILRTNYNLDFSTGFIHAIIDHIDIVSRVTLINSFKNKMSEEGQTSSRFVPIQIGFEIGLRLRV